MIARLTQVKGIGVWTAHMFLIFALRRNDVLPMGDLGIRNAIRKAYGMEDLPTPAEMERWRSAGAPTAPWRAGICGGASKATRISRRLTGGGRSRRTPLTAGAALKLFRDWPI